MAKRPGLLSWQDYKIVRFQKLRSELYPADFRRLCFAATPSAGMAQIEQRVNDPDWDIVLSNAGLDRGKTGADQVHERVAWALGKNPPTDRRSCSAFWQEASLLFNLRVVSSAEHDPRPFQYFSSCLDAACDTKFRVWSDFVRDFYLTPLVCLWAADTENGLGSPFVSEMKECLDQAGNVQFDLSQAWLGDFPCLWAPAMLIYVTTDPEQAVPPADKLPDSVLRVLLNLSPEPLPQVISPQWHLAISAGNPANSASMNLPGLSLPWQGWIAAQEPGALLSLLDLRVHAHHLERIAAYVSDPPSSTLDLSVVITTYHRSELLRQAILSVARQTLPHSRYEILVINNDPADLQTRRLVETLREEEFAGDPQRLRLVDAPIAGLSYARNAGLAEANGEVVCFLDDDALAHTDWLERIWEAFDEHSQAGVVGGHILLRVPQPRPGVLKPGLERFWTHFTTPHQSYWETKEWMNYPWGANWCARRQVLLEMGGFRGQYGRQKDNFSGGEEIIAASLAGQLGFEVAIEPRAQVDHQPDLSRYTYRYLRRTIIAQIIVNYRMKRDLYLSQSITILNNLKGTQRFLKNLVNFFRLPAQERGAVGLEYFYLVQAWARLSVDQFSDLFWRFYYRRRRQC